MIFLKIFRTSFKTYPELKRVSEKALISKWVGTRVKAEGKRISGTKRRGWKTMAEETQGLFYYYERTEVASKTFAAITSG